MRIIALSLMVLLLPVSSHAGMVRQRWGPESVACTYPETMQALRKEAVPRLLFDLSALPRDARIYHASLCNKHIAQPGEAIQIYLADKLDDKGVAVFSGKPLTLETPWYRSFDATEAVKLWAAEPARNFGLACPKSETFELTSAYLEIAYEQAAKNAGDKQQATGLKVTHHDGQTFLTWKELDRFVPKPEETVWIDKIGNKGPEVVAEPGKGYRNYPRLPAVHLGELRRMEMITVIDPPSGTQNYPTYVRDKNWPDIKYRIYRSKQKITPDTLPDAQLVGEADVLCAYDQSMKVITSKGEYYDKREQPASIIPTYCIEEGKSIMPGEAFYMHTPAEEGAFYYAVTVVMDGTENTAAISDANSLPNPITEKPGPIKPVFQYISEHDYRGRHYTNHKYYCWPAPPCSSLPTQHPQVVTLSFPATFKNGGGLQVGNLEGLPGDDFMALEFQDRFGFGGHIAYNQGVGTLLSVKDSRVDYFSERYVQYLLAWVFERFNIDRKRVQTYGLITGFAMRHPELVKMHRSGPFEIDCDLKFNHAAPALMGMYGPPELAMTTDGIKAWDLADIGAQFRRDPAKDVPYFVATIFGKESGHAIEYGWQDDPKGWAALRDGRQCFVGAWGGGTIDPALSSLLARWPADKSMPAFSNCSLDDYPGNGDPSDGDVRGQINGHLAWDYDSIVEKPDRWEMTVFLGSTARAETCTVDITPRHCTAFKPKAGEKFKWTNTVLADGKLVATGELTADKWGLLTISQTVVTKGKNRIVIVKQ